MHRHRVAACPKNHTRILLPKCPPTCSPPQTMDAKAKTFLFDILNTPSPTGFEIAGQRKWAAYARRFADKVENDAYGTAWATLDGTSKKPRRVMFEAHADEIGFIIKH